MAIVYNTFMLNKLLYIVDLLSLLTSLTNKINICVFELNEVQISACVVLDSIAWGGGIHVGRLGSVITIVLTDYMHQ